MANYHELWLLQPELCRNVYVWPNFSATFFQRRQYFHSVQNRSGSDLDSLVRVWPNASGLEVQARVQESSGLVSGRMDHIVQSHPRSDLVLADCVRFGPNRSSLDYWKQAGVQESSGLPLANASKQIQVGCGSKSGMFTGVIHESKTSSTLTQLNVCVCECSGCAQTCKTCGRRCTQTCILWHGLICHALSGLTWNWNPETSQSPLWLIKVKKVVSFKSCLL